MTAVTMPDLSNVDLALISSGELKRRAVLASQVDFQWRQPTVTPRSVRTLPTGDDFVRVTKIKLLPGGEWLVLLLSDGTLCLQGSTSTMPCVVDHNFKTENPEFSVRMNLSLSEKNETLVLLRTWSWDTMYVPSSRQMQTLNLKESSQCTKSFHHNRTVSCRHFHALFSPFDESEKTPRQSIRELDSC